MIWTEIQTKAPSRGLDPRFVYAVAQLESNFNAHARNGEARGLMQIKPAAWRLSSDLPYETAVWDWHANLSVALEELAGLKRALVAKGKFSYPLLWASFRYGLDFVAARDFDMSRMPKPTDPVAYRLWSGDPHPVDPPAPANGKRGIGAP